MREGWTYKKLGEVCKVIMGQSPDGESVNDANGIEFHQGKVFFGEKYLKVSNSFTEQPSKIAEPNSVLLCVRAPVGVVNLTLRRICIGRGLCAIQPNDNIIMPFIYYALTTKQAYFDKNSTGSTFKAISSKIVTNTVIPVPPLAEQQRIVAELDLLQGIIEKKKEQLKAYDQLAQSIFYTMFGDPITNEKGWQVKKLGEICENCDSMRKPITAKDREQGEIPYYGASGIVDYVKDYIFDGDYLLISEDGANLIARSTPIAFSIKGKTWVNNHAHVLKFTNQITQQYVEFSINLRDVSAIVTGCAQPKLTQANLNRILISFPPLSLQQEFAEKVEAIERQKALVQQSIEETQTMFDYTMDKYFG